MAAGALTLVLADQLSLDNPALRATDRERDVVLLAEVAEEAGYVRHNRHKIVLLFSAMRHFRDRLLAAGYRVIYFTLDDQLASLEQAVAEARAGTGAAAVRCCAPGEYRLAEAFRAWPERLGVPVAVFEDDRFLASREDFEAWASGRRQLRMEYFYREMRRRYRLLLTADGEPEGGQWNYDAENRSGWRGDEPLPPRPDVEPDAITRQVIELVERAFPDNPGDLSRFRLAVTAEDAEAQFDWFLVHALDRFGTYQDALAEESPWLFHALLSMYLNCGLLAPLALCRAVEARWRAGHCSLAAAEGFIRQVLGWREFVRGVYWLQMPAYAERNALAARRPLPGWFWNAETDLRCLQQALAQTLELGYAHHIQRLMVIGNFALLAGLEVRAVCDWYLAVYVDAYEWVELPNTLGMALHGDGGIMASKPYAASGNYIHRQGNHCARCRYDVKQITGEGACPFNALYWRFVDRHAEYLRRNARMGLMVGSWRKRERGERDAIVSWGDRELERLCPEG